MKHKLCAILSAVMLCALCVAPAQALQYTFDGADDYLFGRPTSDNTICEWENPNVDRSRNAALVPPGFGTPTSYLPGSGEYLTPNLIPGALSGGLVNQTGGGYPASGSGVTVDSSGFPTVSGDAFSVGQTVAFTEVTSSMYYSDGSLGVLKIPLIGVAVKVYEGTDSAALAKGAGHFENTSIWSGNVCVAGHNRGVNCYFGDIHTLNAGDTVTLTTMLGTRTYAVTTGSKEVGLPYSGLPGALKLYSNA